MNRGAAAASVVAAVVVVVGCHPPGPVTSASAGPPPPAVEIAPPPAASSAPALAAVSPAAEIEFSPDGRSFAAVVDGVVLVDSATGQLLATFPHCATKVDFRADGRELAVLGCADPAGPMIFLWDLRTHGVREIGRVHGAFDAVTYLTGDSTLGLTGVDAAVMRLSDGHVDVRGSEASTCTALTFDAAAVRMLSSPRLEDDCEGQARVLDAGRKVLWHGEKGESAELSPDGRFVAYEEEDGVAVQAIDGGALPARPAGPSQLLGWSPSGKHLALGSEAGGVWFVDAHGAIECAVHGVGENHEPVTIHWADGDGRATVVIDLPMLHSMVALWEVKDCRATKTFSLDGRVAALSGDLERLAYVHAEWKSPGETPTEQLRIRRVADGSEIELPAPVRTKE